MRGTFAKKLILPSVFKQDMLFRVNSGVGVPSQRGVQSYCCRSCVDLSGAEIVHDASEIVTVESMFEAMGTTLTGTLAHPVSYRSSESRMRYLAPPQKLGPAMRRLNSAA